MPYCIVNGGDGASNEIKIFYRTYGHGPIKVLLIIGLAGTHEAWGPQVKGLAGTDVANDVALAPDSSGSVTGDGNGGGDGSSIEVCAFDNRGMGRSSVPTQRSQYTTTIMAKDAIAIMDHLGWRKVHVFGHSMGGMIACKLASIVPERVQSLALLNITGGGFECLPKLDRLTVSVAVRFLKARTPEERAAVDLDTHYSQDYLDEQVGQITRRAILYQSGFRSILPLVLLPHPNCRPTSLLRIILMYPAYSTMLRHLLVGECERFKTELEKSLSRGKRFAASARRCKESCVLEFD